MSWQPVDLTDFLNQPAARRDWGPWRLDPDNLVIFIPSAGNTTTDHCEGFRYYIDLERCLTSAQVLDWIMQIDGKNWADDGTLAGLVHAVDDVLHPQATLCSFGQHKTLTEAEVRRMVDEAA